MKHTHPTSPTLFDSAFLTDAPPLHIVRATFAGTEDSSFETLLAGYSTMRVLTYSNSVSIIKHAAAALDDLEIVFGRADVLRDMVQYIQYQEALLTALRAEVVQQDMLRNEIAAGTLRLYVVKDIISHEKLFLLNGPAGQRVITGSANFSERAFSGVQNESYICFDDDPQAWAYFGAKYERIKQTATMSIDPRALLASDVDIAHLPIFASQDTTADAPKLLIVQDKPSAPTVVHTVLHQPTPKKYSGLSSVMTAAKGVVQINRSVAQRAVQHIKNHARTEQENPHAWLTINTAAKQVTLAGQPVDLAVARDAVQQDVATLLAYFAGYTHFHGDVTKLAADYFTFMSWLYISPFLCDFRNYALAHDEYVLDYPVFGLLYGKSNCGKSQLIRTLLCSMVEREGFLPNEWFTTTRLAGLREQNRRFPLVFDDLDKTRFNNHALAVIKDDDFSAHEYPVTVLSMNAEKDTFESEVRKRCLIIYTGASLPDHTGDSRRLAANLIRLKKQLGTALYRAYMGRVLDRIEQRVPPDILHFSSSILVELFAEHTAGALPAWCRVMTMDSYVQTKHDKVKAELLQLWQYNAAAWSVRGDKLVLRLDDIHSARKLLKDIPDYLTSPGSRGDLLIFDKAPLEAFLEVRAEELHEPVRPTATGLRRVVSRFFGTE